MTTFEIIALVVTIVGVLCFAVIFTILYRSYSISTITEYEMGNRDVELIDEAIYENQPGVKKLKKVWHIIKQVLFYLVLAILVPTFAITIYSKFNSGIAMIGGKGIIVVASGSMSEKNPANSDYLSRFNNQFDTYDIIVLEKVSEGDLQLYDVIAFSNDKGVNIIHRIKGYTEDGKFITRGDSNNKDDEFNPTYNDVLGRYTGKRIPYIGIFVMFLQSYSGMVTILAVIYCLIMIERMTSKIHKALDKRTEILYSAINLENELDFQENLKTEFIQKIYFKGFAYSFDNNGFIEKTEIIDDSLKEKSNDILIKERIEGEKTTVVQEIIPRLKDEEEDIKQENGGDNQVVTNGNSQNQQTNANSSEQNKPLPNGEIVSVKDTVSEGDNPLGQNSKKD